MKKRSPLPGQALQVVPIFDAEYESGSPTRYDTEDISEADVITSRVYGTQMHKVVIDIDLPAKLLPSTTKDHHHLYIDHEMTWEQYLAILEALAAAGIVQDGYVGASRERGFTAVRLPWVKKHHMVVTE